MKIVSIVILNYNGATFLEQFLPVLLSKTTAPSSFQIEFVVADNASEDHSVDLLNNHFPKVKLIQLDKNYGFADGYNQALKQISADYYLLLNSDIEVTDNWLSPLLNVLENDATAAVCQPKVLAYNRKNYFEYAGASGGYIDYLGVPFCRGRIFDSIEQDHQQYDDCVRVFWATGACFLIKSDIFWQAGGFEGRFFAHMEEIDLCWRINRLGYKVFCEPSAVVYHVGGGTLADTNPFKTYLNFRNGIACLYKNTSRKHYVYIRVLLDWLIAFRFLLMGQPYNTKAIIKAHIHFIKDLGYWQKCIHKDDASGISRKVPENLVLSQGLPVQYLLFRRRKFSALRFLLRA